MKDITLSADENLIASARAYAQAHGATLNDLIRGNCSQGTVPIFAAPGVLCWESA
jgi:hypothetical protein